MIILDAGVIIGFRDADDAHHGAATTFLLAHAGEQLGMSTITKAETLVNPVRVGRLDEALEILRTLMIEEVRLDENSAVALASLRVTSGLKMPDCCVVLAALQRAAAIASFDQRLCDIASSSFGLVVYPQDHAVR